MRVGRVASAVLPLEADFPGMGIPNDAGESSKVMSLETACHNASHSFNVYHCQRSTESMTPKPLLEHDVAFLTSCSLVDWHRGFGETYKFLFKCRYQ